MNAKLAVFYVVIGLALFGLVYTLITDPGIIMNNIIRFAGFAAIIALIYFIYRRWTGRKPNRREQLAFKKAVRQSKKRYGNPVTASKVKKAGKQSSKKTVSIKKSTSQRSDAPKLTVIEGKKGKKKKRMSL